ncbi:hypothetical protein PRUPE_6G066600 [Prunus persica]|uniref:SHSP domain-containing protein n=1 Tax=Prunus persica TaxID=3760 RepID=A0A251NL95_PRUPE|nr:hypothetical protein PRUPE_6G066600 [Prunus persica]
MSIIPSFPRSSIFDPFKDIPVPSSSSLSTGKFSFPESTGRRAQKPTFQLPENAKVDEIKAAMENGALSVTVPKAEVKKADVKAIEIN